MYNTFSKHDFKIKELEQKHHSTKNIHSITILLLVIELYLKSKHYYEVLISL